jgi:hypothetical protein
MELLHLGQIDTLLTETVSWMQARLKGVAYEQRFNHADILLSEFIN